MSREFRPAICLIIRLVDSDLVKQYVARSLATDLGAAARN